MTPIRYLLPIALLFACQCSACAMADPAKSATLQFIPEHGTAGGGRAGAIKPSALLKILRSPLANPTQKSLDRVLEKTDRVRVYAGGEFNGKPLTRKILMDSRRGDVLTELKKSLRIDENPDLLGHDMCYGDPTIELMSGKKRLAVLGFHHGRAIRFDKSWKFDGPLKDGWRLVQWFSRNGIDGPEQAMEAERKEIRKSSADLQKWMLATPECLRPFLQAILTPDMTNVLVFLPEPAPADSLAAEPHTIHVSLRQKQLMSLLDSNFHDQHDKILALMQWYASGVGAWTGFPTYEELPAELLLTIPTRTIIEGLNCKNVSEPELEGAARFFAWRTFRVSKPQDLSLLDTKLKRRLLEHCLNSADMDKRKRAERAFSQTPPLAAADNRASD
jgi:hypothetical protein